MMSSAEHPALVERHCSISCAAYAGENSSRPVDLRRRRGEERRGSRSSTTDAIGVPRRASAPSTSYARFGTSARTDRVDHADTRARCRTRERSRAAPAARRNELHVRDAAEVLRRAPLVGRAKSIASAIVTSGAPCPPAATIARAEVGDHRPRRCARRSRRRCRSATSRAADRARRSVRATRSPRCRRARRPPRRSRPTAASREPRAEIEVEPRVLAAAVAPMSAACADRCALRRGSTAASMNASSSGADRAVPIR